jgi:DNA-binding response OmpR family regulator
MTRSRFAGKRILLIEDDVFVRDVYRRKLSSSGFEVGEASDGMEGMRLFRESSYDLVMLDIFMPYLDGRDMLREIKSDPERRDVPVILLTNFSANEGVRDGFGLGAEEYLIKAHFTPSEVLLKVESVLGKYGKDDTLKAIGHSEE